MKTEINLHEVLDIAHKDLSNLLSMRIEQCDKIIYQPELIKPIIIEKYTIDHFYNIQRKLTLEELSYDIDDFKEMIITPIVYELADLIYDYHFNIQKTLIMPNFTYLNNLVKYDNRIGIGIELNTKNEQITLEFNILYGYIL